MDSVGAFGSQVVSGRDDGMVSFGNVAVSAREVAAFIMMYRTYVLRDVGTERTNMAQQHLDHIKEARGYYRDLTAMKLYASKEKSYKGRVPMTPAMKQFLEDAGMGSQGYVNQWIFYGSAVLHLPPSTLEHYGLELVGNDFVANEIAREEYDWDWTSGSNQYEMHGLLLMHDDSVGYVQQKVNNYIEQLNDENNLFMTKFRAVINNMNTALEAASTLIDRSNDLTRSVSSNW